MSILEAEPEGAAQTVVLEVDDSSPQIIGPTDDEGRPDTSCVVAQSEGTSSEFEVVLNEAEPEDEERDEESSTEERTVSKRKYPYAAMFFIMTAVVGQRCAC